MQNAVLLPGVAAQDGLHAVPLEGMQITGLFLFPDIAVGSAQGGGQIRLRGAEEVDGAEGQILPGQGRGGLRAVRAVFPLLLQFAQAENLPLYVLQVVRLHGRDQLHGGDPVVLQDIEHAGGLYLLAGRHVNGVIDEQDMGAAAHDGAHPHVCGQDAVDIQHGLIIGAGQVLIIQGISRQSLLDGAARADAPHIPQAVLPGQQLRQQDAAVGGQGLILGIQAERAVIEAPAAVLRLLRGYGRQGQGRLQQGIAIGSDFIGGGIGGVRKSGQAAQGQNTGDQKRNDPFHGFHSFHSASTPSDVTSA